MSEPTGHGALGRALIEAWGGGRRSSYQAKGWHAKLRALVESPRGSAATDAVGWNPSKETVLNYLGNAQWPVRPDYEAKIHAAYEVLAGAVWDPTNETREYRIVGLIDSGDRAEERVLRIDGSAGDWSEIRRRYLDGSLTPEQAEEFFIVDVIEEDIGETTGNGWDFPGSSYTV